MVSILEEHSLEGNGEPPKPPPVDKREALARAILRSAILGGILLFVSTIVILGGQLQFERDERARAEQQLREMTGKLDWCSEEVERSIAWRAHVVRELESVSRTIDRKCTGATYLPLTKTTP